MPFLILFSRGQGGQNLKFLAGSGGSKPSILRGGVKGVKAKIFFGSLRSPSGPPRKKV